MIENENIVVEVISKRLFEYDIKSDTEFQSYLYEVVTELIDIYYEDLLDSVKFLYHNEYLDDTYGNIIEVLQKAQGDYYLDIAYDNLQLIYDFAKINYL